MAFDEKQYDAHAFKNGHCQSMKDQTRTNWPFDDSDERPFKKIEKWFVDNKKGITMGIFTSAKEASQFARFSGGIVRYYCPTSEEHDKQLSDTRHNKRISGSY